MYKRTSRFFPRRPSSMPETESRRELHSTLEKLDHSIGRKKKSMMQEKSVTVWNIQRKACLGALFFVYVLLSVPCIIDLVHYLISSKELEETIQVLEETVKLHSSTTRVIHGFHCLFMNIDCETRMLRLLSESRHRCLNEDHLLEVITAIVKSSPKNSSFYPAINGSTLSAFSSYPCAETTFQHLHTAAFPKIGSLVVQSLKYIRSSYAAFDVLVKLYWNCFANDHTDMHHFLQEVNYVKGHLLSFFLKEKSRVSIKQLDILLIERFKLSSNESSDMCSTAMLQEYLSTVNEINDISSQHLQLLLKFTQSEHKWSIIVQSMYIFVLLSLPFICSWHFVEYWRRLVLVHNLSQQYNMVTDQLMKEKTEFKSILSEVIPRSNFGEVVSEGSRMSLMSSAFRPDSQCEPVQVSFSDTELSDGGEETDRPVRTSRRISSVNRFKQKSVPMGTIHETYSIYDKITKKLSCKRSNPSLSNEVTIFRSDIVGFSRIMKYFTASEMVNLVSYLMKLFDERIQLYDVFVLGREADSFTVISGITSAQTTRHASEIVNMALDLMSISSDLEFQTGPETKLRLRMGIHTGVSYSRQVGFPRPRFNICGDILEVAKKIVQNAQPNQIQVSETTYQLLCRQVAYNLGKSGHVTTEANKNIKVYTLNGRRVSEDVTARDCPGKRTAWIPIQLEQKALYRFEAEENRYLAPLNWMMPSCSYSMASGSTSPSISNTGCASRQSNSSHPLRLSLQESYRGPWDSKLGSASLDLY